MKFVEEYRNPILTYLEKEVGAKWLVYSSCDFARVFPRLECPFCRNNEQGKLKFFRTRKAVTASMFATIAGAT